MYYRLSYHYTYEDAVRSGEIPPLPELTTRTFPTLASAIAYCMKKHRKEIDMIYVSEHIWNDESKEYDMTSDVNIMIAIDDEATNLSKYMVW